ncbi:nucleoside recognition domain-containing protein [Paenibacillus thalictri]|nr:nucleoside recognition domain-containing protein [Paenibacillus thalictri]
MNQRKAASATVLMGLMALLLVVCIILFPDKAFHASLQGLHLWWKLVFPALLPFFILTEMMTGMGVIHGLGKLLEPAMRRLLKLPGAGGWSLAIGWIAGFPAGAAAVRTLSGSKLVKPHEADRLLSLSHTCSPVFLVAVVGVGFFQNARLGLMLAVIHYGSALLLAAVASRFKDKQEQAETALDTRSSWLEHPDPQASLPARAAYAMQMAHQEDGRTFGKILGDSVISSVNNLMAIGGYIMMFSVLLGVIGLSGAVDWLSQAAGSLGLPVQEVHKWLMLILPALTEVHLGTFAISQTDLPSPVWQASVLSAALAWGGLSVHLQVRSLTIDAKIRFPHFVKMRGLHAALAFVSTWALWTPLERWLDGAEPSFLSGAARTADHAGGVLKSGLWFFVSPMMLQFGMLLLAFLVFSIIVSFIWKNRRQP